MALTAGCLVAALAATPAQGASMDVGPAQVTIPATKRVAIKKVHPPSRRAGSWAAKILVPTVVSRKPGGKRRVWIARPRTKFNGQAQRLLVLGKRRTSDGTEWLRVRLPTRPNDAAGWIPYDRVLLSRTRYRITIDTGRRELRVYRGKRLRRKTGVVVGEPKTPTPRGLFAIYESVRQPDPHDFLGTWALHLTSHSNVLQNFGGGDGRVAIHGRGGASFNDPLGTAASHGCVRVDNRFINWLERHVGAGTPVRIVG